MVLRVAVDMALETCEDRLEPRMQMLHVVAHHFPYNVAIATDVCSMAHTVQAEQVAGLLIHHAKGIDGDLGLVLRAAVSHQQEWAVKLLLARDIGTNPDAADLHECYELGGTKILEVLLQAGAAPDVRNAQDQTIAERIVTEEAPTEGCRGLWMLHHLVDHGADTNHRDAQGTPLLHHACMRGSEAMVNLLVRRKARIGNRDAAGRTALHVSCEYIAEGIDQNPHALLDTGALQPDTERCTMVKKCIKLVVEAMLAEAPILVDYQDHAGNSAMHIAARFGADELVKQLHDAGADPELRNKQRDTPNTLMQLHSEKREILAADDFATAEMRRKESIVGGWTAGHVVAWLCSLQLGVYSTLYARAFAEAGVDGQDLLSLTDADLCPQHEGGLGVDLVAHRRKILRMLDAMCETDDIAVRALDTALSKAVERHCTAADERDRIFDVIYKWNSKDETRSQGPALALCG